MTNKPFPETKETWQTAVYEGMGLTVENGRLLYAARQFTYSELKAWFRASFSEGYHPDFGPALQRNAIGFADWVYGSGGEPNWARSDEQQHRYRNSLPKKRMGAGALIMDEDGRILLVEPTYKPVWEIPGGVVEQDESPRDCCQREVKEELGLSLPFEELLIIDYNTPTDAKSESLMFIFDGGTLKSSIIKQIKHDAEELESYQFFTPNHLPKAMTLSLKNRILAAWQVKVQGGNRYIENGLGN
ncbi:MAG: NUDIX hydrolase [Chloroflexota bacterium]